VTRMHRYHNYSTVGLLCLGCFWFGTFVYQNHWAQPESSPPIPSTTPVAIPVRSLGGETGALDAGNLKHPTLLLVLSADCRYCEQNAPTWRELIASIGESKTPPEVLALSLSDAEDTGRYLEANALTVSVLLIDQAGLAVLGLRGVPGTIALDPGSDTMRSWIGVLSESEVATILTWAAAN